VGEFVPHGGEVLVVGARLAAVDAASGRTLRRAPLTVDVGNITLGQLGPGAAVAGRALLFGWYDFATGTGTVFCFDTDTLALRWQWQIHWSWIQRTVRPTLAVVGDAARVYAAAVGKTGDNVFAFRLADGRLLWSRSVETFPAETGLALAEGRLLVRALPRTRGPDWHEFLEALAVEDGRSQWRVRLTGDARYHPESPLVRDGHVYTSTRAGVHAGYLFAVRVADGDVRRDDVETSGAPFAVHGDVVYLGGWPTIAYDADRGRTVWRASPGRGDRPTPPMIAGGTIDLEHNRVLTGDSQRFVYVLAADTGALLSQLRLDLYPRFELSSPLKALYGSYGVRRLAMHRGQLLVGTTDSSLFVFRRARPDGGA
jgi:outer membrane protein assembly factor BamB